jgi:hypothetical protein
MDPFIPALRCAMGVGDALFARGFLERQKETRTAPRLLAFVKRSDIFAITNAKMSEPGQEVLSERSELRNLTPVPAFLPSDSGPVPAFLHNELLKHTGLTRCVFVFSPQTIE